MAVPSTLPPVPLPPPRNHRLDDALGLIAMAGKLLAGARTGRNGRHAPVGLPRQSVFGRLAGCNDRNDTGRLRQDSAMRWIAGGKAAQVQGSPTRPRSHLADTLSKGAVSA